MTDGPGKDINWVAVFVFALAVLAGFVLILYAGGGSSFVYDNV
ncbi:hypothetical protein MesoLjLc_56810 [Mesorhizobium sp. L-8-10]|nr:hypothetical protein [Mesorhizobium sp. L-8-10]BCH33751.1 hypothetical protein MesoLjLc_56810 [Mesorhizobium sp. L-8-10]